MIRGTRATPFYLRLAEEIERLGGMLNAHLHLDRAGILDGMYINEPEGYILDNSYISLQKKHHLINVIHDGPAYEKDDMKARVNACIDVMVECNTRRADTVVDVTADRVGLTALRTLAEIKHDRADVIDLRLGAYSPLGFKDTEPQRWDMFEQGVDEADFISALPEADDTDDYPENIGFDEHCRRFLVLAQEKNLPVHVHVDQRNEPGENGTERLIQAIEKYGAPVSPDGEPMVWAIHVVSPSTYDEERFQKLLDGLVNNNIGVITCPSAAIGMRQLRPLLTPTYNSIPRILEMLGAGVHVRLASDNISDMASPSTTADLTDEVFVLSAAIRFYHIGILAKLAAGKRLDENERSIVIEHLEGNNVEIEKVLGGSSKRSFNRKRLMSDSDS
jgi:cytosine/adenosine deaminase-related metal-dependent hydrolase